MSVTSRRLSITVAAGVGLTALVLGAAPADAATPPSWPTAGRVPTGCASVALAGGGASGQFTFTDATVPAVAGAGVSFAGGKRILVVPPTGAVATFEVTVTDGCSGVGSVHASVVRGNGTGGTGNFAPVTTDAFGGRWQTAPQLASPANAGPFTFISADVARRYDSFVLSASFRYLSSVGFSGTATTLVGPWSTKPIYILRASTLTSAVSRATVKRGKKVTVTGQLKTADIGGYVGYPAAKVVVQTKVGSGAWRSRATLTTSDTGTVAWKFTITKKTQVRLVAAQVLASPYTAGATSPTRAVKLA